MKHSFQYLKDPFIRWFFGYMVIFLIMVHVPFEFYQGYISNLDLDSIFSGNQDPIISGLIRAIGTAIAALFATNSIKHMQKIGIYWFFTGSIILGCLIILVMGVWLHPIGLILITLRTIPEGMMAATYPAVLNPKLESKHRATFFSLSSLVGRLCYGLLLFILSYTTLSNTQLDWFTLQKCLLISCGICFLGLFWLIARGRYLSTGACKQ